MEMTWKQIDESNDHFFEKQMEEAKKGSTADRDFYGATQFARRSARQDDLLPVRNEFGEFRYTLRQGLKAACFAREDAAATLVLQRAVLLRLDRNKNLLWVLIALLSYVAYQAT